MNVNASHLYVHLKNAETKRKLSYILFSHILVIFSLNCIRKQIKIFYSFIYFTSIQSEVDFYIQTFCVVWNVRIDYK